MRIQNNIESMNAYRNLNTTNRDLSKSLERLSSGFRINRAADDAAGLAISEKMRSQISGLNQAVRNAQDGISLIQTAEGALNETHSILQGMRELANQAANDTYTADDRAAIQQDIDQLVTEITRIGDTTEFNTENLLDGDFTDAKLQIGANSGQTMDISIGDMTAAQLLGATEGTEGESGQAASATAEGAITHDGADHDVTVTGGEHEAYNDVTIVFAEATDSQGVEAAWSDNTLTVTVGTQDNAEHTTAEIQTAIDEATGAPTNVETLEIDVGGEDVEDSAGIAANEWTGVSNLELSGGAEGAEGEPGTGGIDVTSQDAAGQALDTLDTAIEAVSTQRSELGALQNRLEHTITNLEVASENLTAAESRIRDVDMAAEMTEFTKNQILTQAGTAMLAQANMAPQAVLQLLG